MALVISMRPGEIVSVGETAITYSERRGNQVRLKFEGPKTVEIKRFVKVQPSQKTQNKEKEECP